MKQQYVGKKNQKSVPQIIDNRQHKEHNIPDIKIDPATANKPVRAVFYVEVGDMEPLRVQLLIQEINKQYSNARGGVHYVVPIRHGKIGSDIVFEKEWENVVRQTCEIRDGQICLKDEAKEVCVIRESI